MDGLPRGVIAARDSGGCWRAREWELWTARPLAKSSRFQGCRSGSPSLASADCMEVQRPIIKRDPIAAWLVQAAYWQQRARA